MADILLYLLGGVALILLACVVGDLLAPKTLAPEAVLALQEFNATSRATVATNSELALNIRTWKPTIPKGAASASWQDIHTFPPGRKPKIDPYYGLVGGDPPISMICPACDLEQAPLHETTRPCGYCGIIIHRHGSTVFWWRRPITVEAWPPDAR